MIVKCEQCQTKFKIPDDKVTEKGVKVRCTKCGHTFRVKKEPPAGAGPEADPFAAFGAGGVENQRSESSQLGDFGLGLPLPPKPSGPAAQPPSGGDDDAFQMPTRAVTIPSGLLGKTGSPTAAPPSSAPKAKPKAAPAAPAPAVSPFDFSSLAPAAPAAAPFDFAALGPASSAPKPAAPPAAAPFDLFGSGAAAPAAPGARFDPFAPPAPIAGAGAAFSMAPAPAVGNQDGAEDLLGLLSPPPGTVPAAKPAEPAVPAYSGDISLDALDIPGPREVGLSSAAASAPAAFGFGSDDMELDLGASTLPNAPAPRPSAKAPAPKEPPKKEAPQKEKEAASPKRKAEAPTSNLLGDIPFSDTSAPSPGLPAAPPTSLLGDDDFGMPPPEDRASLFDMPVNEAASSVDRFDDTSGGAPAPSAPLPGVAVAKLQLKRVTAESFLSPEEDVALKSRRRVARLFVNVGFAIILVLMIGLVGLVYLNDGKLDSAAFSPGRMKAALTAPKDFVPVDVSNGLYETRAERALFFVRGDVLNLGSAGQRLKVRAELYDGERLVTSSDAVAGGAPSPEDLYAVMSANELKALNQKLAQAAPPVAAGERAPFLVAFFEYPPDLKGFRVKLVVTAEGKETAHRSP